MYLKNNVFTLILYVIPILSKSSQVQNLNKESVFS